MTIPPSHDNTPGQGNTPPANSTSLPAAPPPPADYVAAAPGGYNAPPTVPGKTLGIVALVVAVFFNLIGVILGIIALVQSKNAGHKNGFALAAIIVGGVLLVVGIIVAIVIVSVVAGTFATTCAELGPGIHNLGNGSTISCG